MSASISRAQFLRGDFSGRSPSVRPPWALPPDEFLERCTRCGDCRRRCPRGLIQAGPGGFPVVDFTYGACDFCGACAGACVPGALAHAAGVAGRQPWRVKAQVTASCLSLQGITCRVCAEQCEARAIRFRPGLAGRAQPLVDARACTGCGACCSPCPGRAITLATATGSPTP